MNGFHIALAVLFLFLWADISTKEQAEAAPVVSKAFSIRDANGDAERTGQFQRNIDNNIAILRDEETGCEYVVLNPLTKPVVTLRMRSNDTVSCH